jgi:cold shock CspA family protein
MRINGVVRSFDEHQGYGYLLGDDATMFYFHCTSIGDGSRTISQGARVSADRHVGRLGRDEAANVTPIS